MKLNRKTVFCFSIHSSKTGKTLIRSIQLDQETVEDASSDNSEGHFRAGDIGLGSDVGINPNQSVYALAL